MDISETCKLRFSILAAFHRHILLLVFAFLHAQTPKRRHAGLAALRRMSDSFAVLRSVAGHRRSQPRLGHDGEPSNAGTP